MSIVLLYAGEAFSVNLQDKLREMHDDLRVAVISEIARRKDKNVPLDGLEDPGYYEPRPALAGIAVKGKVLSAKMLRRLEAQHADAQQAHAKLRAGGAARAELAAAADAIYDAKAALVAAVVTEVGGFGGVEIGEERCLIAGDAGLPDDIIDALERVGLILPLFDVAQHMQGLSAKKA